MGVALAALPLIATVAGGVGAGVSAYGAYESGQANKSAAAYQAEVAANNAKIAQQNATWDIQAGEVAADNQGLRTRGAVGAEKAGQGAAGVSVNSGTAPDVRAATEALGMQDAMTIRSNAARAAYGAEVQATSDTAQSQLDTMQSRQAGIAGDLSAGGSLLQGISTVGGRYAAWQNSAGPGSSGNNAGMPLNIDPFAYS